MLDTLMKKEDGENKVEIDNDFISSVQPIGGITFNHDKFIKTGEGYIACIYVYQYSKYVDNHWLASVLNINNSITVLDISTEDQIAAQKNIGKSLDEQIARHTEARTTIEQLDANQRIDELERIYSEVSEMGEVIKLINIRIFVSAKTMYEAETKVKDTIAHLESSKFKAAVALNEGKNDYKALFLPYKELNKDVIFKKEGQPILSNILAAGNPFHFTALKDDYGSYLGYATAVGGGSIIFDQFAITNTRLSYDSIIVGKKGSGKSTLLKKLVLDRVVRNDYVRIFDPVGEFASLTEYLGGSIIKLDGSDGTRINILEILKSGETDSVSYSRHLSKVSTIYKYLNPEYTQDEIIELEKTLRELYVKWGFIDEEDSEITNTITGFSPERYPTLSDLLKLLKDKRQKLKFESKGQETKEYRSIYSVSRTIENIMENYGSIFDGHTSIINIYKEQLVVFDIHNLVNFKEEIFDAVLFNALSLCWDGCVALGSQMKRLYEERKIKWEDIIRTNIIIDEAHRIINARKITAIMQILIYAREGRKWFTGLSLASQSISDFVPDGSSDASVQSIVTLFELSTYKFILNQDANAIPKLAKVFQNQFEESELEKIPILEKGKCILSIAGESNIEMKIDITEDEDMLFTGGA